jgi:prepilin-type N-terminal cleavage/methylation domain-containing protein
MPVISKNKKAFTLVELLVVMAMLGVVSLAVYAIFNNGFKVWQKVNQPLAEEDSDIFLDKWTVDLRNCLKIQGFSLTGDKFSLEIPTLVNSAGLNKKTIGRVIYSYDSQSKILTRQQSDFSQLFSGQEGGSTQLLKNVDFLQFEYYYYDSVMKIYYWKDECLGDPVPLAVRVGLGSHDQAKNDKLIKTVNIPING